MKEQSFWKIFGKIEDLPSDGWKVHVSLTPFELSVHRELIFSYLQSQSLTWKIPGTDEDVRVLTEPELAGTSLGKILTIYIGQQERVQEILSFFRTYPGLGKGPKVHSCKDERWPWLGWRFGSITTKFRLDNCGRPVRILQSGEDDSSLTPVEESPGLKVRAPCQTTVEHLTDLKRYQFVTPIGASGGGPYRALDTIEGKFQLLKFGSRGISISSDCKEHDSLSRLENEYAVLHRLCRIRGKALPTLERLNDRISMLKSEFVDGEVLHFVNPQHLPQVALAVASAIAELHAVGIGHGDLKPANILFRKQSVPIFLEPPQFECFIDFEASGDLHSTPDPQYTSYGFSRRNSRETYLERDLFGFGVSILSWALGHEPGFSSLDLDSFLLEAQSEVHGMLDPRLTEVIAEILNHPSRIQTFSVVVDVLRSIVDGRTTTESSSSVLESNLKMHQDESGRWFGQTLFPWAELSGINIGAAGIHLALQSLQRTEPLEDIHRTGLQRLLKLPQEHNALGFFTGAAGVAHCLEECGLSHSLSPTALATMIEETDNFDLFSGLSGVLLALLAMERRGKRSFSFLIHRAVERIIQSIREDGSAIGHPGGRSGEYPESTLLGASHGSLGTAFALLEYAGYARDAEVKQLSRLMVKKCADMTFQLGYLPKRVHLGRPLGLTSTSTWCHGDLGLLWVLAHIPFEEDWEAATANLIIERLIARRVVSNPSICHGVSGVVDALNRMLRKDHKILNRMQLVKALAWYRRRLEQLKACNPRGMWEADKRANFAPDFMVGFMGPVLVSQLAESCKGQSWAEALNLVTPCE